MEYSKNIKSLNDFELIKEALIKFKVQDNKIEFIRHNENLTFKIDDKYLLRIHKSADTFQGISNYIEMDQEKLRLAELEFLEYLRGNGMNLQVPVRSGDNSYIIELSGGVYATMLNWIPGVTVDQKKATVELCREIGQMVAKLHKAAAGFYNENALRYDSKLFLKLKNLISGEIKKGNIKEEHGILLEKSCEKISEILKDERAFITLHSDLSLSNILITESGLVPIDFSLFGFAHPMMDIASLFGCVNGVDNRRAIAKGYTSLGYSIDFPMLDTQFAISVLLYIAMHLNLSSEEGFNKNLDRWCRQIFGPFVAGKRLISEDFYMLNADK